MAKPAVIKAAWITGGCLMLATIISIFVKDSGNKSSDIITSGNIQGQVTTIMGDVGTLTIPPPAATEEVIEEFEKRLSQADDKIELTKNELRLLAQALKDLDQRISANELRLLAQASEDLDQRTSAMVKLPDGRTKFGSIISGTPSVVIDENNASVSNFQSGDYAGSLKHSQNAIKAYEDTKEIKRVMSTGDLTAESVGTIYRLGAMAAQRLKEQKIAYQYAKKSVEVDPLAINNAVLASTSYNLKKYQGALDSIEKALQGEPHNSEFIKLRKKILLHTQDDN